MVIYVFKILFPWSPKYLRRVKPNYYPTLPHMKFLAQGYYFPDHNIIPNPAYYKFYKHLYREYQMKRLKIWLFRKVGQHLSNNCLSFNSPTNNDNNWITSQILPSLFIYFHQILTRIRTFINKDDNIHKSEALKW